MAIAFVGGTNTASVVGQSGFTVSYGAIAGNVVVAYIGLGGPVTALTMKDNNGTVLTTGPTATVAATNEIMSAFYTAAAGVTAYTLAWTTSKGYGFALAEYSGVTNGVNAGLAGNTATGSSAAPMIIATTQDNNDWLVGGFNTGVNVFTVTNGTERAVSSLTGNRTGVVDNTAAVAGAVTLGGTLLVSSFWSAALVELRVTAGTSTASAITYNQLMMVGCGT